MSLSVHLLVPVVMLNFIIITARNLPNLYSCTNKTMSEAIIEKCPLVANDTEFISQAFLSDCSKWCEINGTKTLTRENENDVLCLLYYDTFVPFCTGIIKNGIMKDVKLVPNLKNYTIKELCSNLAILPNRSLEHNLKQMVKFPSSCEKLCTNYDDTAVTQCSLAHYFSINFPSFESESLLNKGAKGTPIQSDQTDLKSGTPSNASDKLKPRVDEVSSKKLAGISMNVIQTEVQVPDKINTSVYQPKENTSDQFISVRKSPADIPGTKKTTIQENSNYAAPPNVDLLEKNDGNKNVVETDQKVITKGITSTNASSHLTNVGNVEGTASKTATNKNASHADSDVEKVSKNVGEGPEKAMELNIMETEDEENGVDQNSHELNPAYDVAYEGDEKALVPNEKKKEKPVTVDDEPANYNTTEELDGESYFFSYFMAVCVLFVLGYVVYHNRAKVLALVLEGKRGKRQYRGRRPNSANYHKLDSNLEEAISSSCTKNSSHVIY